MKIWNILQIPAIYTCTATAKKGAISKYNVRNKTKFQF